MWETERDHLSIKGVIEASELLPGSSARLQIRDGEAKREMEERSPSSE
jgi:hypothetical protein